MEVARFPVTIQRSRWSPTEQAWRTFLVLAVLVGLGGIISIFLTHGVPNWLRHIAVRDLIIGTTPKIRAISTAVDSNLRTAVRVERTRLLQRLRSRSRISPDFAALARDCEAAAVRLDREITLLDRIDAKMRQIERKWPTAGAHGPTLLQRACEMLTEAQLVLDRPDVDDDVVNAADAFVQRAETTIENAATIDAPSKTALKSRLESLAGASSLTTCDVAKQITAKVPGLAAALNLKPDALSEANFADYDAASAKLEYVRRFVELCETVEDGTVKRKSVDEFIAALRRGGFSDFRRAEALTTQMREGIFTDRVAAEIKGGRYSIEVEPQATKVNQVVSFAVSFHDPGVDAAAARHAITCTWRFEHPPAANEMPWLRRLGHWMWRGVRKLIRRPATAAGSRTWTEKGLAVSHYFPVPGTFDVVAEFRDEKGDELPSASPIKKTIIVDDDRLKVFGEHTKIEYARLAVVLVITVAGLLVGAREELAKLDLVPGLIAVFMLGFTADQIKNILAPTASK